MGVLALAAADFAAIGFSGPGNALVARVFCDAFLGKKFDVRIGRRAGNPSACESRLH